MFEKLQSLSRLSGSNELEFLRSHPLTKNRIADAQSRARAFEGNNYRDSLDYGLIRNRTIVHFSEIPRQAVTFFIKETKGAQTKKNKIKSLYGLALAYSEQNNHTQALEKIREALEMDKENLILQIGLLELHIEAENYFEADALASSLLRTNPKNYPITMLYNRVLMNKNNYELSEEILKELSITRPKDPQVWYWLAEVQGLDKNLIGLHLSRAEYFFLTGSYETSIKHLRMAMELTGNNFQLTESIHNKIERSHKSIEALKNVS
jgi:predicted Zn-dependent protease